MFDDPDDTGDIDRNGVPDSIQLDPVMTPLDETDESDPAQSNVSRLVTAINDITFGVQSDRASAAGTLDAEPIPRPDAPTPPPPDADEAALDDYQKELGRYNRMFEML
jgi:hypothetical protein